MAYIHNDHSRQIWHVTKRISSWAAAKWQQGPELPDRSFVMQVIVYKRAMRARAFQSMFHDPPGGLADDCAPKSGGVMDLRGKPVWIVIPKWQLAVSCHWIWSYQSFALSVFISTTNIVGADVLLLNAIPELNVRCQNIYLLRTCWLLLHSSLSGWHGMVSVYSEYAWLHDTTLGKG